VRVGPRGLLPAAATAAALACAACGAPTVMRSVDGQLIEGRYIPPRAYALYAIGTDLEAHGDLRQALAAFELAQGDDGESPEIWTRIGALRCKLGGDAEDAFRRALGVDDAYEPAWRAWARCAAAQGKLEEALDHAEVAVRLDPNQEDAILLRADLLERLGRVEDARRALRALVVRRPRSVGGWRALAALAMRAGDTAEAERAARRVREIVPRHQAALAKDLPGLRPLAELDTALRVGDLRSARKLAREAGLPPAELAVRAAALGRAAEARAQAELVLGADPASASARVALAAAADLAGNDAGVAEAWSGLPGPGEPLTPPSPLARLLFAELLARRVGDEAALAWLGQPPEARGRPDPLEADLAARVRRQLEARP